MMVDAELVEVVGGGDLEHEGGGRGRLRVSRDPGMLQTLRHAGPVAESKQIGHNLYFENMEGNENIIEVCVVVCNSLMAWPVHANHLSACKFCYYCTLLLVISSS